MRRSFRYRLYPNRTQDAALHVQVNEACRLYNAALEERRSAWKARRIALTYYGQSQQLRSIRASGDCAIANFSATQEVLRRVERTFRAFMTRSREGSTRGYPRFKPRQRYCSLTFPSWGDGCRFVANKRLYLQGVGGVKVNWHRPIPAGAVIKSLTVKRDAGRWYVSFCLDIREPSPLPIVTSKIGLDLGLTAFAVCSDGVQIENPRHFKAAERRLRVVQRRLARRRRGSRRRQKTREVVARLHAHIANQRRDFHHKVAMSLVRQHGLIAIEDLNVVGLARGMLAKQVHDAGWAQFIRILTDKASSAGRLLIAVNPAGTTQNCSRCAVRVPKRLGDRRHVCGNCGLSTGRDHNAAQNILRRALDVRARMGPSGEKGGGLPEPWLEKPPALLGGVITDQVLLPSQLGAVQRCPDAGPD